MELLQNSELECIYHGGSIYYVSEYTEPSTFCQLSRTCKKYHRIFINLEPIWIRMRNNDINNDIMKLLNCCNKEILEISRFYYGFRSFIYSARMLADLLNPEAVDINIFNVIEEIKLKLKFNHGKESLNLLVSTLKAKATKEGHYHLIDKQIPSKLTSTLKCSKYKPTKNINQLLGQQIAKVKNYPPDTEWFEGVWNCIYKEQNSLDSNYNSSLINILVLLRSVGFRQKYGVQ